MNDSQWFTAHDIAHAVGQTKRTICRYLRERFPHHPHRAWWRFTHEEFLQIVEDLLLPCPERRRSQSHVQVPHPLRRQGNRRKRSRLRK